MVRWCCNFGAGERAHPTIEIRSTFAEPCVPRSDFGRAEVRRIALWGARGTPPAGEVAPRGVSR
jgi:hypothetical protein